MKQEYWEPQVSVRQECRGTRAGIMVHEISWSHFGKSFTLCIYCLVTIVMFNGLFTIGAPFYGATLDDDVSNALRDILSRRIL